MENLNKNSIFHANILYLILGIFFVSSSFILQGIEIYPTLLITQYIIVLLPNLIYLKLKKLPLKKTLKLNKISFKQIAYVVGITIFTYPVAVFLNLIVLSILSLFGDLAISSVPIPDTASMYLVSLFVIGISPGICEEIMFRGTIMNAYSRLSKKKAIIYSAILFGIFHLNLQNLVGPILLGIIFGIVVYKTNSIYSSMIGHALNNSIAMTIGYLTSKGQDNLMEMETQVPEILYETQMIISIIIIGVFALISTLILVNLIKKLPSSKNINREIEENNMETEDYVEPRFFEYLPILGIVLLFVLVNYKFLYL